eukprot:TRINITY_DN3308_c0_g2_i1.p1 TRINITY_DN3308_c0_g2~~TRINITY_DN3308_c0_g2_i1.p1  ORF type:complete len:492 (-),score=176.00 TRINITY_DN3308_c0_g2_i1:24-1388(-)
MVVTKRVTKKEGRSPSRSRSRSRGATAAAAGGAAGAGTARARRIAAKHVARVSVFDDAEKKVSFRGFMVLALMVLLTLNARLVWENIFKYGILIDFSVLLSFVQDPYRWPAATALAAHLANFYLALQIERLVASRRLALALHALNTAYVFALPIAVIYRAGTHPAAGVMLMLYSTTFNMKLASFAVESWKMRRAGVVWGAGEEAGRASRTRSAFEPTIARMAYFVIAPTLVYEPEYPRTPRIRRRRLVFLLFKAIVLTGALLAGVQQYITPLGNNSIVAIRTGNIVSVVERVLKLAVPNMMIWLVGFYVVFHLQLNIVAEVTRFADRLFYRDWWNSSNLDNFWRTWNLPVHNWIKHTVYLPLVSAGVKRSAVNLIAFLISAALHEVIVSVPFRNIKMWAFLGMIIQVPMVLLTRRLFPNKGSDWGNAIFWCSILLGQPLLVLTYFYQYSVEMAG